MDFTITRFVTYDGDGPLKAFCDVAADGMLLIKGVRVIEGRRGPFVSMPRQQGKAGQWYDSVVVLNTEARAEIARLVLETFRTRAQDGRARNHEGRTVDNKEVRDG